jgi:hypothetical protein
MNLNKITILLVILSSSILASSSSKAKSNTSKNDQLRFLYDDYDYDDDEDESCDDPGCKSCPESLAHCEECKENNGYYTLKIDISGNHICEKCITFCKKCENSNICIKCRLHADMNEDGTKCTANWIFWVLVIGIPSLVILCGCCCCCVEAMKSKKNHRLNVNVTSNTNQNNTINTVSNIQPPVRPPMHNFPNFNDIRTDSNSMHNRSTAFGSGHNNPRFSNAINQPNRFGYTPAGMSGAQFGGSSRIPANPGIYGNNAVIGNATMAQANRPAFQLPPIQNIDIRPANVMDGRSTNTAGIKPYNPNFSGSQNTKFAPFRPTKF